MEVQQLYLKDIGHILLYPDLHSRLFFFTSVKFTISKRYIYINYTELRHAVTKILDIFVARRFHFIFDKSYDLGIPLYEEVEAVQSDLNHEEGRMGSKLLSLSCVWLLLVLLLAGCSTGSIVTKMNPQIDGSGSYRASFGEIEVTLELPARAYSQVPWIFYYLSPAPTTSPAELAYTLASFIIKNGSPGTVNCSSFNFVLHLGDNRKTSSVTIAQFVKAFPNIFPNAQVMVVDPWQTTANGTEKVSSHESGLSYRVFGSAELNKIKSITVTYPGPSGGSKEMKKL